jgi:hypothetical protein
LFLVRIGVVAQAKGLDISGIRPGATTEFVGDPDMADAAAESMNFDVCG